MLSINIWLLHICNKNTAKLITDWKQDLIFRGDCLLLIDKNCPTNYTKILLPLCNRIYKYLPYQCQKGRWLYG